MSQPDAKVTLNRLKQTISQLQQVVERLEAQQGTLPPEALDSLAQDVATLSSQVRSSPPASQAKSREDVSFEPAMPETKTTVPPQTPSQAVPSRRVQKPSLMQRLSELLRQRRFVGILLGAIAVVFIWQFALGTPRTSPDMSQTEPADQLEQVDEQPPISQPSAPVQKAPTARHKSRARERTGI